MSGISDLQAVYAKIAVEPLEIRLARNIATRRKVLGLTQAQLAEKLGVETETLSRFERGKHLPSLATLERLAGLLQVTVSELLAEQPKMADDDALVISSWIAHLDEDDKRFVRTILKQCCEHLEAKSKLLGSCCF